MKWTEQKLFSVMIFLDINENRFINENCMGTTKVKTDILFAVNLFKIGIIVNLHKNH